jgi:hypothetical protein
MMMIMDMDTVKAIRMHATTTINGNVAGITNIRPTKATDGHRAGARERKPAGATAAFRRDKPRSTVARLMCTGHPYYYYQDDAGRMIVRRPTIHVEVNVP